MVEKIVLIGVSITRISWLMARHTLLCSGDLAIGYFH